MFPVLFLTFICWLFEETLPVTLYNSMFVHKVWMFFVSLKAQF